MACACKGRAKQKFLWTSGDGTVSQEYNTEIEAKAKVLRVGGSYKPLTAGV